ncbi:MAG: TetR/AcrR family transcriptional regulator [Paracoccaceae bacterium]|nr:TetR/AcrR family transcriptional regulator [Paracoccaceae bacterium]
MKPENRKKRAAQIEAAAYELLEKRGFDGLSMQAVARSAKASNETLYRWYGDKTGLFKALIRGNATSVNDAISIDGTPALQQLETIGTVLLSMLLGPRAIALNKAAAADASGELGRALAEEGRNAVAPRIAELMNQARQQGDLAGTPSEMTETYFALLIADLQIRRVTGAIEAPKSRFFVDRAARAVEQLAQLYPPEQPGPLDARQFAE